ADLVLLEPVAPDIVHLLHAERYPSVVFIDAQHLCSDRFALLENFVGILDPFGPADVTDVHQAIKAILDFDECAEFHDVADFAGDHRAHGIFFRSQKPWIGQRLLHTQRNAAIARFDVKNHNINFVASLYELRGIHGLLGPAHFGRVYEAFDAGFEFDERAVIHNANHPALELAASGIFLRGA